MYVYVQGTKTRAANCRKIDSNGKTGRRTIKADGGLPRRRTDYAIAAEDAQEDPYGCFPSCFMARQSRPHIFDTPRSSINLRERTTYVLDLVCPPTSVITFASVTTLRRYLRGDVYLRSYIIFLALKITLWRLRLPSSIPRRCISWFAEDAIWSFRSLPPPELYGCLGCYPRRCPSRVSSRRAT